jgi:hypothetical protein
MNTNQTPDRAVQHSEDDLHGRTLPLRHTVRCLLTGCWIIGAIMLFTFHQARASFPLGFGPLFEVGVLFFLGIIGFYLWTVHHTTPFACSGRRHRATWLWLLAVLSVVCTSSLHQFAPFRPDILLSWPGPAPTFLKFIRYNYVFTGVSLLSVAALAVFHYCGYRRFASTGLLVLAGMMLVPNDDCPNNFNRPWLTWLGASPLMFLPNSVVLLLGYCGLQGIRSRISALMMGLINAWVLLLGIGHSTGLVW